MLLRVGGVLGSKLGGKGAARPGKSRKNNETKYWGPRPGQRLKVDDRADAASKRVSDLAMHACHWQDSALPLALVHEVKGLVDL